MISPVAVSQISSHTLLDRKRRLKTNILNEQISETATGEKFASCIGY